MTSNRSKATGLKLMEGEAAKIGFVKVTGYGGNPHGVAWRIQCCRCDTKFEAAWGPRTSPDLMAKNMRRKGWDVDVGQGPLCPFHAKTHNPGPLGPTVPLPAPPEPFRPNIIPAASVTELHHHQPKESPMSSPAQSIPQNPKLARSVFAALEENFDVDAGRYRNAMSDDKIATLTGAAVALVIATREQAFGQLAEDPMIAKLRDDIDMAQMEFDDFKVRHERNMGDLKRRLDSLVDQKKLGR